MKNFEYSINKNFFKDLSGGDIFIPLWENDAYIKLRVPIYFDAGEDCHTAVRLKDGAAVYFNNYDEIIYIGV